LIGAVVCLLAALRFQFLLVLATDDDITHVYAQHFNIAPKILKIGDFVPDFAL